MESKFKVGDVVAVMGGYSGEFLRKSTIVKITPKRGYIITTNDQTVYRSDGHRRGGDGFDRGRITHWTPGHDLEVFRARVERRVRSIQWAKLSEDQLRAIDEVTK